MTRAYAAGWGDVPMSRRLVDSAAALVAALALVGILVQSVGASKAMHTDVAGGVPRVNADPSPTPVATPTPFDESVAEITALSMIDDDGYPDTTDDRHVFEGPWQFAADFGDAEVLSAEPTSNSEQPASWLIKYTDGLDVTLIDDWPPELALLLVECVASHDTVEWSVDVNLVLAVLSGSGPVSLNCLFVHSPADLVPLQGFIEAYAFIDPDADASTDGFEFPQRPVKFTLALDNADVVSEMPFSVDGDGASWEISYPDPATRAVLTQIPQDGFELVRASCFDFWMDVRVPSTLDGDRVSFEAQAPNEEFSGHYACNFVNVRTEATPRITLPPTDVGPDTARRTGSWPPLLVFLLATVAGVMGLNFKLRRSRSRTEH